MIIIEMNLFLIFNFFFYKQYINTNASIQVNNRTGTYRKKTTGIFKPRREVKIFYFRKDRT